jgi:Rrf2 family nitric oxide-sensitive transcriptional repressor
MTLHTDYALRTLIYLATRPDEQCTVNDVAEAYQLSRNHLLKVAQTLRGWRRLNLI